MKIELEDVCELVAVQLGRRRVEAVDRLVEDLDARSMDLVNVVAALEDRYDVEIDEGELPDLRTVADLHRCVQRHRGGE